MSLEIPTLITRIGNECFEILNFVKKINIGCFEIFLISLIIHVLKIYLKISI